MPPATRKTVKLGDVTSFSQGIQVPVWKQQKEYKEWLARFIRIVDFTKWWEEPPRYIPYNKNYEVAENDIVMIRYWSQTAWRAVRGYKGMIANNMFKITVLSKDVDENYLFYVLWSDWTYHQLRSEQNSTTMPALTFGHVKNFEFSLPPLPTQQRIAGILSRYDDLIENNTRRIEILEQQAQALYRQWFVEYKFPWHEDVEMINSGTEFGEIPEWWEVKTLGEISTIKGGKRLPKWHNLIEKKTIHPYIRVRDFHGHIIDTDSLMYITEDTFSKISKYTISYDDLFISIAWTIWLVWSIPQTIDWCNLTENAAKIVFYNKNLKQYVLSFLKSSSWQDKILWRVWWASQPKLALYKIESIDVPIPKNEILEKYESYLEKVWESVQQLQKENNNLKKQRDILLPKLVSGEILVGDV